LAAQSRVLFAGEHHQRCALRLVAHGRVVDAHLFAARFTLSGVEGEVQRDVALAAGHQPVPQPDIGERAAHHHLVVAAPRAVGIEIAALDAVGHQVAARRAVEGNAACR
jgi:hypothetical protein